MEFNILNHSTIECPHCQFIYKDISLFKLDSDEEHKKNGVVVLVGLEGDKGVFECSNCHDKFWFHMKHLSE